MCQIGTKPAVYKNIFRNVDAASIPVGAPIVLAVNGTEDGFAANLPSTATAVLCPNLFLGVCVEPSALAKNDFGTYQSWGLVNFAIVEVNSRTASTNSFSTQQTLNTGVALSIDTVNNAFATYNVVTGVLTIVSAATTATITANFAGGGTPVAVLAQTVASQAASATTTSDTRLVATAGLKVFVRAM